MSSSRQGDLFGSLPEPQKESPKRVAEVAKPPPAAAPAQEAPRTPAWRRVEPPKTVVAPPPPAARAAPRVLSVSELTSQVKDVLEPEFSRVLVRGEVSNFRGTNARGHLYFTLKDARAAIDVKLWATAAQKLRFQLKDGLSVIIEGNLDVYEPQGRYSLIVNRIEPEGVGAQALAFEQLKQKLLKEGLIGDQRIRPVRPLPLIPRRIGVVTSVTGAALRDFLKVLHRRHPRLSVLVADARVQGDGAAFELRRALRWLAKSDVDVIVVTRGGGSVDDLWTFNEEPVVRAIWDCPVPVVSAVGHEIDTTLCDLVADLRAPTPSAAAELVAPSLIELETRLATLRLRMVKATEKAIVHERSELRHLRNGLGDPRRRLSSQLISLSQSAERMRNVLRRKHRNDGLQLSQLRERLQRVQPQAQLKARRARVVELRQSLVREAERALKDGRRDVAALKVSLERHNPRLRIQWARGELQQLSRRLDGARREAVASWRRELGLAASKLDALSPLKVLGRGYAIAQRDDGHVVRAGSDVKPGEQLRLRLERDTLRVQVTGIEPKQK
ncbi:MAG: exodeoxyribonuclease VII large subunit [Archangium gephyra]|uniref:Exodeoxyribonuclease 7 large subunit n=1 Tax=Archangium gephyra TaxID=48 RepID=A0A2W5V8B3_9BACT|nr:MAG: exodeoxyribonuclease VII large subunit [Archangium gephyra]